mmetsp:Transcript_26558/g.78885  ORF Transcript_26558/g.78885 Transcript_26558/m.78885 type:complete len:479 (-) Transcript_26558:1654-3090(-)
MFKKLVVGKDKDGSKDRPGSSAKDGDVVAGLHRDAHDDGGLSCNNDELLRQQEKAILKWMKTMGQRLFSGNVNVLNTPFPVEMFEPRSYLEKLADVWVYPRFLAAAAEQTSPLDRMKLTITWFIAGLHHSFEKWKKPFNPILGETWQASLSDGSSIAMEQISHHPPVSAFQIEGPNGKYRFVGLSQPHVSIMLKAYGFKTTARGYRFVEFHDGSRIAIEYPSYVMKGVVYSSRPRAEVEGTAVFLDQRNCLKAFVRFGSHKNATGAKAFMRRSDAIIGEIYDVRGCGECERRVSPSGGPIISEDEFESASETDWDMRDDDHEPRHEDEAVMDKLSIHEKRSGNVDDMLLATPSETHMPSLQRTSDTGGSGKSGMFSKMFGLASGGTAAPVAEVQSGTVVSTLEGSWLSHLDWDGKRCWTLLDERPDEWMPVPRPLQSDCRYRQDLSLLYDGKPIKEVQVAKESLEHQQRADAKLRGIH